MLTVRIESAAPRGAEGTVLSRAAHRTESPLRLVLAQGIAKGDKMETIIRMATELGVTQVVPLATARAVVKFEPGRREARVSRWQRVAQEAAKQSGRAVVPEIARPQPLDEWLSLRPRRRIDRRDRRHPLGVRVEASRDLLGCPRRWRGALLAVCAALPACGSNGSAGTTGPETPAAAGGTASTTSPLLMGCPVFPPDNAWNRDVSADAVDPRSDAYIASIGAGTFLHPDFGSDPSYGIPWTSVPGTQPRVPMSFDFDDESDPGPYPFPPNAPVEGGGDRHVLVLDRDACQLYETFDSEFRGAAGWRCGSGAKFDLRSNALRPDGFTSADAAGLPILPGLVRRDEVLAGEIRHALRFTVRRTQRAYVHPATHFASSNTDPGLPPMGLRVRMKASYDIGRFTGPARVILVALKRYGMFVADNGSDWFISGETNTAWNDDELEPLKTVPGSAFEVVRLGEIQR
jgi:hypothetical protein